MRGEEILHPNQNRVTEQAKVTYSPLEKAYVKQIKTIENQSEKQIKATEEHGSLNLIPLLKNRILILKKIDQYF